MKKRINNNFKLSGKHYHKGEFDKHQILLMDSTRPEMTHYIGWENKKQSGYKNTTPYTIGLDGTIYEHYSSENWSDIFNLDNIDKGIIPVTLENEGHLSYVVKQKTFINWCGDIYMRNPDLIYTQKWRGGFFWAPYSHEQIESLGELVNMLCDKHGIKSNVKDLDYDDVFIEKYHGVVTKNDYNILSTHINPSFDMIKLKQLIEK